MRIGDTGPSRARITFVNGAFAPELSSLEALPPGVNVTSLACEIAEGAGDLEAFFSPKSGEFAHAFEAINAAAAGDGAVVSVDADVDVDGLIELLFWSDGAAPPPGTPPRARVVAGPPPPGSGLV
jgi:Fe-S cluster assembly protein SufD